MSRPYFFSWVDQPLLAAHGEPNAAAELVWLRAQGIDILVTLTEESVPRSWVDAAGLMNVHVPIPDMSAPTLEQIEQVVTVIDKAQSSSMGVAIHCLAGKGRTGTMLAAYYVHQGASARDAMAKVRDLRPGSIEVSEQEEAVQRYERQVRGAGARE